MSAARAGLVAALPRQGTIRSSAARPYGAQRRARPFPTGRVAHLRPRNGNGQAALARRPPPAARFSARNLILYPAAARLLLQGYRRAQERGIAGPMEELSEREVLGLAAEGLSSKSIAKKLGISSKTVDTYRSRLMRKLGRTDRTALVRFALLNGLLRPPATAAGP